MTAEAVTYVLSVWAWIVSSAAAGTGLRWYLFLSQSKRCLFLCCTFVALCFLRVKRKTNVTGRLVKLSTAELVKLSTDAGRSMYPHDVRQHRDVRRSISRMLLSISVGRGFGKSHNYGDIFPRAMGCCTHRRCPHLMAAVSLFLSVGASLILVA